jgi:flagellar biosynthesis/type III secretory pathway protein FliH
MISKNPFAVIVMAHLKELETKGKVDERLFWKVTLVKRLYEKGYSKEDVLLLYKFIDWLVSLPEELAERFHEEIKKYEEVRKVAYITTAERIGMKKGFEQGLQQGMQQGLQQGIQQGIQRGLLKAIELGLKLKFGVEGLRIYPEIKKIEDVDVLEAISEAIETAQSIEDIRKIYKEN